MNPWPGSSSRPASRQPPAATAAAASTIPVSTTALAASTAVRAGTAVSVVRIMPVLYSPLTASTASTATSAWPNWIPVRLSRAGSTGQARPRGHRVAATAAVLTAMVSAAVAASSQAGPGTVRTLVHSARTTAT